MCLLFPLPPPQSSRTALQEAIDRDHQEIVPLLMKAMAEAKEKVRGRVRMVGICAH